MFDPKSGQQKKIGRGYLPDQSGKQQLICRINPANSCLFARLVQQLVSYFRIAPANGSLIAGKVQQILSFCQISRLNSVLFCHISAANCGLFVRLIQQIVAQLPEQSSIFNLICQIIQVTSCFCARIFQPYIKSKQTCQKEIQSGWG